MPSAAASSTPVVLDILAVTIPDAAARRPQAKALLDSFASAPGGQVDAAGFARWRDQLDRLVEAGAASVAAEPRMTVVSGQSARLQIGSQQATGSSELEIGVVPVIGEAGPITIRIQVRSEEAHGELETWAREAGLSLGPSGGLERTTIVLPGGGAGLVLPIRSLLRQEGYLVVIVLPRAMPSGPAPDQTTTRGP